MRFSTRHLRLQFPMLDDDDYAGRLRDWLLARARYDQPDPSISTRDLLRLGPVRRVRRLNGALRVLAGHRAVTVLRCGRRRWVRVDTVQLFRAPLDRAGKGGW
jgi:hypothetical protein